MHLDTSRSKKNLSSGCLVQGAICNLAYCVESHRLIYAV